MDVIYGLIPGMLILGLVMVGVLFWAARSGQFDDLDGDGQRILMDDDYEPSHPQDHKTLNSKSEKPDDSGKPV